MRHHVALAIVLVGLSVAARAEDIVALCKEPVRQVQAGKSQTLHDILSRLSQRDANYARDPREPSDVITQAHEGSHFLASQLSTSKARGFYLLGGEGWRVPLTKNTRLSDVAAAVPKSKRGRVYKTYLLDAQGDWEAMPLVLLDEWIAYQHGAMVRAELGIEGRGETVTFAAELALYSHYFLKEVEKREQDYPIEELKGYYQFLLTRARIIGGDEWKEDPVLGEVPSL